MIVLFFVCLFCFVIIIIYVVFGGDFFCVNTVADMPYPDQKHVAVFNIV